MSRYDVDEHHNIPRVPGGVTESMGGGPSTGPGHCFNCGNDGHLARNCKDGNWKNLCYQCGERGHIQWNCPSLYEMLLLQAIPKIPIVSCSAKRQDRKSKGKQNHLKGGGSNVGFGSEKQEVTWQCVSNCGACCKLDKGPAFATPDEIFQDPSDIQLYRSMIGPDGWCKHYVKSTRTCSIYADRPYFCRVEPDVFEILYGFDKKRFNKEACSCCRDTIKAIHGPHSKELDTFNRAIKSTTPG